MTDKPVTEMSEDEIDAWIDAWIDEVKRRVEERERRKAWAEAEEWLRKWMD